MSKCVLCGEEIIKRGNAKICKKDHYYKCIECGNLIKINRFSRDMPRVDLSKASICTIENDESSFVFTFKNFDEEDIPDIVCNACYKTDKVRKIANARSNKKTKEHLLKIYGVDNVSKIPSVKQKISKKVRQNFKDNGSDIKRKYKETCLARYGTENAMQSDEIKEKRKQLSLEKNGVEHHFMTESFKKKRADTFKDRYSGGYPTRDPLIKQRIIDTNNKRYKADYPFLNGSTVREAIKQHYIDEFGVDNPLKVPEYKEKMVE